MDQDATMTTDDTTGAMKQTKLARFDLIPVDPLVTLAEHYGRGATKYADRNWEKGYAWSKSYAAMMRHAVLYWAGEDNDPETGSPHMAAVAWHAFALMEWAKTHPEMDDRPCCQLAGSCDDYDEGEAMDDYYEDLAGVDPIYCPSTKTYSCTLTECEREDTCLLDPEAAEAAIEANDEEAARVVGVLARAEASKAWAERLPCFCPVTGCLDCYRRECLNQCQGVTTPRHRA